MMLLLLLLILLSLLLLMTMLLVMMLMTLLMMLLMPMLMPPPHPDTHRWLSLMSFFFGFFAYHTLCCATLSRHVLLLLRFPHPKGKSEGWQHERRHLPEPSGGGGGHRRRG